MTQSKLTARIEEERQRTHDQSQLVYLQNQIDELHRIIKDQTNKYHWALEQVRKNEGMVSQLQTLLDEHRESVAQMLERSRRDTTDLRRDIASTMVRIDEGLKPIRDMQAQIQQLAEARKQDREYVSGHLVQIEETERKVVDLNSRLRETDEQYRQLGMQLERLREADTVALQEARRVSDELQGEKQTFRRQVVETQQQIDEVAGRFEDTYSRLSHVEHLHEQVMLLSEAVPDQISEIAAQVAAAQSDVRRVETNAADAFMMSQERLEDLRHDVNERLHELRDVDEQHYRQLLAWLERLDSYSRDLDQRINQGVNRLDLTHRTTTERIAEMERRELQVFQQLREAFMAQASFVETEHVRLQQQGQQERPDDE